MKLGVMIEGQEGLNWERWRKIVRATEDLGFESLWRSDHFFSLFADRNRDALETMVSLTYAADNTSRVRFGPLVCPMTFRHPSLLARMAASIDQLSGGRFVLGIGAGWNVPEHDAFGIDFPSVRRRMDMLEESAAIIRALWSQDVVSFEGKVYQLKEARLNPKPVQGAAPLLIGGSGEKRTLRIVARYADEWNATAMPHERYREKVRALEAHCKAVGRDPSTIERSLMLAFLVGTSEDDLRERKHRLEEVIPGLARLPDGDIGSMAERGWLVGTPEQAVEQIRGWQDEGVGRIMLQHHNQEDFDVLRLLAKEVLPAV